MKPIPILGRWARTLAPDQSLNPTWDSAGFLVALLTLLVVGWYQQSNMILLVAGLASGPLVASLFVGGGLGKSRPSRRAPRYVFAGGPLAIDYVIENKRRVVPALALWVEDQLVAEDRTVSGWTAPLPRVFFARVTARGKGRARWEGTAPGRGRYQFGALELVSRAPFGLIERRMPVKAPGELLVYPAIGRLTRTWQHVQRQTTQTRRGRRHDRSAQQQEYHGLRDYRPGDSPRWVHWRTSARLGRPMIKEFEQQHEEDLAILVDAWLPRSKPTTAQREAVEEAVRFAATLCMDTCRRQGRRLLLGCTGTAPVVLHGPASVKLLHSLLEQLAVLRPAAEGSIAAVLDAMPPAMLREARLVIVSTRPIQLHEEIGRSTRLAENARRAFSGSRVMLLDASKGDLNAYFQREDRGDSSSFMARASFEAGKESAS